MVALLDVLRIDRVLALGFSDGGIVGLLLAALHPQCMIALAGLGAQPGLSTQRTWQPFATGGSQLCSLKNGRRNWRSCRATPTGARFPACT